MSKLNDQQQFRRDKLKNLVKNGFNFPSSTFEHDNLVEINEKFSQKLKEFFLENQIKIAFAGRLIRQRG
ncbi:hypothetical protein B5M19_02370, partial [Mesomycoplasma hyopneumoniae]